jgi:hypothetical protein
MASFLIFCIILFLASLMDNVSAVKDLVVVPVINAKLTSGVIQMKGVLVSVFANLFSNVLANLNFSFPFIKLQLVTATCTAPQLPNVTAKPANVSANQEWVATSATNVPAAI